MSSSCPTFAVVGRPNKGKSSIVATLSRDDSVYIDARPGSTRKTRRYPMKIDGETLYELIDTPGVQRARAVLDWLQAHCSDASERPQAVRDFVAAHEHDLRFRDEYQMLKPIVEGAGIIYVVDGSCPFGADYEAEMEILRWTGRPSLALINPIESTEFVEEWKAGLGQYFQTVRQFDAHRAELKKQLDLLELFGHLDPDWQEPLDRAVRILVDDRIAQHQAASQLITDLLMEALSYQAEQSVPEGVPTEPVQKLLSVQYKNHLERKERQCRKQVEEVFYYTHLDRSEARMALGEADLFNVEDWYLWGLNRAQLVSLAATAGAVVGGGAGLMVDAASGGLLGGLGTLISGLGGGLSSAAGSYFYADRIGQLKVKGLPTGGKRVSYGPVKNLNFPFVLLGRALLHHRLICKRTHASREQLDLNTPMQEWMSDKEQRSLAVLFMKIQAGRKLSDCRQKLSAMIYRWCEAADGDLKNA